MEKIKNVFEKMFSFIIIALIVFLLSTNAKNRILNAQTEYVPPAPTSPASYEQTLAFLRQDKSNDLSVHGIAIDRRTLFEMFPMEARQHILNVNQNWYWGDGSSSSGASPDHSYAIKGKYDVQMLSDISFRGGATVRIKSKTTINIDEPSMPDSITVDSPPFPTSGAELQSIPIILTNTGGRAVSIRPIVVATESGWVSISPIEKILLPNSECPATFYLSLDWTKNPTDKTYTVEWEKTTIVGAWCLKYFQ